MTVILDKKVEISNPKLSLLYWTCEIALLCLLVVRFMLSRLYYAHLDVSKHMLISSDVGFWNESKLLHRAAEEAERSPYCQSRGEYDYWLDPKGFVSYMNATCASYCNLGLNSDTCIGASETHRKLDFPSRVFVASYVKDTFSPSVSSGSSGLSTQVHDYFLLAVESTPVFLVYSFDIPEPGSFGFDLTGGSRFKASSQGYPGWNPMTTIVLSSSGSIWTILPPAPYIQFTVHQLLELAGEPNALDTQRIGLGENQLPGGKPGGPLGRVVGMELLISVECFNDAAMYLAQVDWGDVGEDFDKVACTMRVSLTAKPFVGMSEHRSVRGGLLHRKMNGLQIATEATGRYSYSDFNMIYLNFVSIIVCLALPAHFMEFVLIWCLGHLSVMYRKALRDPFDIIDGIAGTTTRLMTSSASFVQLEDIKGIEERDGGISMARMEERLSRLLAEREDVMDGEEVRALVEFCFRQVTKSSERSQQLSHKVKGALHDLHVRRRSLQGDCPPHITIDGFSRAWSSSDTVDFDAIVDLFDKDRPIGCFERFFTPREVWDQVHLAKHGEAHSDEINARPTLEKEMAIMRTMSSCYGSDPGSMPRASVPDEAAASKGDHELHQLWLRVLDAEHRIAQAEKNLQKSDNAVVALQLRVMDLEGSMGETARWQQEELKSSRQSELTGFRQSELQAQQLLAERLCEAEALVNDLKWSPRARSTSPRSLSGLRRKTSEAFNGRKVAPDPVVSILGSEAETLLGNQAWTPRARTVSPRSLSSLRRRTSELTNAGESGAAGFRATSSTGGTPDEAREISPSKVAGRTSGQFAVASPTARPHQLSGASAPSTHMAHFTLNVRQFARSIPAATDNPCANSV